MTENNGTAAARKRAKKEETLAKMDKACANAQEELSSMMVAMSEPERVGARAVAKWVSDNFMTAGYKRLSRSLISLAESEGVA